MIIYDRFHIFPSKAILENIWVCSNIAFLKILGRQEGNYYFDTDWKFRNFHFGTEAQIEISTSEFDLPCLIIHLLVGRRNEAINGESVISHLWWTVHTWVNVDSSETSFSEFQISRHWPECEPFITGTNDRFISIKSGFVFILERVPGPVRQAVFIRTLALPQSEVGASWLSLTDDTFLTEALHCSGYLRP